MAENLKSRIVLDLAGNLEQRAKQYGADLQKLGHVGNRAFGVMSRSAHLLGQGLDKLGNRWTGLITGGAAVMAVRSVARFNEQMTRIGINANASAADVEAFKNQLFELANKHNIKIDDLAAGFGAIVEQTGNLQFARANAENLALITQASGESSEEIGNLIGQMRTFGITAPKDILSIVDAWDEMGKKSGVSLQDMIYNGQQLLNQYQALGRSGPDAFRDIGAAMAMSTKALGNPRRAASDLLQLFEQINMKRQLMMGLGITDAGGQMKVGLDEAMKRIIRHAHGNYALVQQFVGTTGAQVLAPMLNQYNAGKPMTAFEDFQDTVANGTGIINDAGRAAGTAAEAFHRLSNAWEQFANQNLTGPVKKMADMLNAIKPEQMQHGLKIGEYVGGGLLAAYGLRKAAQLGTGLFRTGKYLLTGKFGKAVESVAGSAGKLGGTGTPVYVTNWPGSLGGGMAGNAMKDVESHVGKVLRPGLFKSLAALGGSSIGEISALGTGAIATSVGAVLAAGAVGYAVGTLIKKELLDKTAWGQKLSDDIGAGIAHAISWIPGIGDNASAAINQMQRYAASQQPKDIKDTAASNISLKLTIDNKGQLQFKQKQSDGKPVDLTLKYLTGPTAWVSQ